MAKIIKTLQKDLKLLKTIHDDLESIRTKNQNGLIQGQENWLEINRLLIRMEAVVRKFKDLKRKAEYELRGF